MTICFLLTYSRLTFISEDEESEISETLRDKETSSDLVDV